MWIKIRTFPFKEQCLNMSHVKCRAFCAGFFNVLIILNKIWVFKCGKTIILLIIKPVHNKSANAVKGMLVMLTPVNHRILSKWFLWLTWRVRCQTLATVRESPCRFLTKIHTVHDDVIKWKLFPRFWTFVLGIHRGPVNSPQKGQWHGALMFSLICAWTNG